jgi:hypothetical protein
MMLKVTNSYVLLFADDIGSNACRDNSCNETINEGGTGVQGFGGEANATARAVNNNSNVARGGNATNTNDNTAFGGTANATNRNNIDNSNTIENRNANTNTFSGRIDKAIRN